MRFVARNCIRQDMILAKSVLGMNGEVLLSEGVTMRSSYIKRMEKLGIPGAYVEDPISDDLEVVNAIGDEVRTEAVKSIASTFTNAKNSGKNTRAAGDAVRQTAAQIVEEIISKGDVMLNLVDMKVYDSYTFFHCVNVTVLSVVIGLGLGYSKAKLVYLAQAALLHDIGKVFIDPAIINKPGKLTPEEYDTVKNHPVAGYKYIMENFGNSTSKASALGVLEHHERIDGSGYPDGKQGERITDIGRVIAIADVYDALVSDRPYRKGLFPVEAMEYVLGSSGTSFDHAMLEVFQRKTALFPTGTCVLLSNGATALVMENFEGYTHRPRVKVFRDADGPVDPYYINLHEECFDVTILSTINM